MFQDTILLSPKAKFGWVRSKWSKPAAAPVDAQSVFSTTLSASLLSDLQRFADERVGTQLLIVVAACLRHARPLSVHLQHGHSVVALSLFPREHLYHSSVDFASLTPLELSQLQMLRVQPQVSLDSAGSQRQPIAESELRPLRPMLWRLAMYGATSDLLPEISGRARFRVTPGAIPAELLVDERVQALLERMRGRPASLDELAATTTLERAQLRRLINALYLQSGLMITRSFPTVWFGPAG